MSSGVLFGLPQGQLDVFEEAIKAAQADIEAARNSDQKKALVAKNLERFVQSSLEIPRMVRSYCNSTLDLIPAHLIDDYQETGDELRRSFAKAMNILESIEKLVQGLGTLGGTVSNIQALREAVEEVRRLQMQVLSHWPDFTEQDVAEALGEFERGECLEIDDAFAQIAGVDKATWLKLVEKRKRTQPS
jgi:hypothetical protein